MKILLIVTGSISCILHEKINDKLKKSNHDIKVYFTEAAVDIINNSDKPFLTEIPHSPKIENEADHYFRTGEVEHIDLINWADIMVVAPCSANTLNKMNYGIADDFITTTLLAFLGTSKKTYIAPAMNTHMWNNFTVRCSINELKRYCNVTIIEPTVKKLACGDFGIGAMADITAIVDLVNDYYWGFPLSEWHKNAQYYGHNDGFYSYLPKSNEPGSFGFVRKHDIHTGVDIYCNPNAKVLAVEDGTVIAKGIFTGKKANSDWWNETGYIVVRGHSGDVLYGEVNENTVNIGDVVKKHQQLTTVKQVLPDNKRRKDIRNHQTSMLHIELYRKFETCAIWNFNENRDKNLLDPTPYLKNCRL